MPDRKTDRTASLRWSNPIDETDFTLLYPKFIPQSKVSGEKELKQRLEKGQIYLLRQVEDKKIGYQIEDLTALIDSFSKPSV